MVTRSRPRPYPRTFAEHCGLKPILVADLVANPITDPATDPRVHTAAQVSAAFTRARGKTLRLFDGQRLCMRERFDVAYDAGFECQGDAAIVRTGAANTQVIGARIGTPGQKLGQPASGFAPKKIRIRVERYIQSDWSDNLTDIGVELWNADHSQIEILGAANFACAVEFAVDDSTAYSQIGLGNLRNAQIGLRLKNWAALDGGGGAVFCNRNLFYALSGGHIAVNTGVNTTLSRYGIHFTRNLGTDAANMDRNTFRDLTFELNGGNVTGGAEAVVCVHDIGLENELLQYYDEGSHLLARWNGSTRGHRYVASRNDDRVQRVEYLGTYSGASIQRADRPLAAALGARYESPDWSRPGNYAITQKTNPSDALCLRGASQIRSSAGIINVVEDSGSGNYTITNGYVKSAATSRSFAVMLGCRRGKEFILDRDADPTYLNGGRFLIRPFDISGNLLGGRATVSGSFTAVADNGGFAQFTHNAHAVAVNDIVEFTNSSVGEYNRDQAAAAISGMAVSGGQMVLTTSAAHKLQPGDWVFIYGTSNSTHGGRHRVFSTPTTTTAVLDSPITGTSTGGYFRARRFHRVTAVDGTTFTTHRAYAGDATGDYSTVVPLIQADGGSAIQVTSSWGLGYIWGSDGLGPKHIRLHQFVDYCLVGVINCALRKLWITNTDGFPVNVWPGHNYPGEQLFGYSAPSAGDWGVGARIEKVNRTSGTGTKDIAYSCGTAGSPGTWQAVQGTLV